MKLRKEILEKANTISKLINLKILVSILCICLTLMPTASAFAYPAILSKSQTKNSTDSKIDSLIKDIKKHENEINKYKASNFQLNTALAKLFSNLTFKYQSFIAQTSSGGGESEGQINNAIQVAGDILKKKQWAPGEIQDNNRIGGVANGVVRRYSTNPDGTPITDPNGNPVEIEMEFGYVIPFEVAAGYTKYELLYAKNITFYYQGIPEPYVVIDQIFLDPRTNSYVSKRGNTLRDHSGISLIQIRNSVSEYDAFPKFINAKYIAIPNGFTPTDNPTPIPNYFDYISGWFTRLNDFETNLQVLEANIEALKAQYKYFFDLLVDASIIRKIGVGNVILMETAESDIGSVQKGENFYTFNFTLPKFDPIRFNAMGLDPLSFIVHQNTLDNIVLDPVEPNLLRLVKKDDNDIENLYSPEEIQTPDGSLEPYAISPLKEKEGYFYKDTRNNGWQFSGSDSNIVVSREQIHTLSAEIEDLKYGLANDSYTSPLDKRQEAVIKEIDIIKKYNKPENTGLIPSLENRLNILNERENELPDSNLTPLQRAGEGLILAKLKASLNIPNVEAEYGSHVNSLVNLTLEQVQKISVSQETEDQKVGRLCGLFLVLSELRWISEIATLLGSSLNYHITNALPGNVLPTLEKIIRDVDGDLKTRRININNLISRKKSFLSYTPLEVEEELNKLKNLESRIDDHIKTLNKLWTDTNSKLDHSVVNFYSNGDQCIGSVRTYVISGKIIPLRDYLNEVKSDLPELYSKLAFIRRKSIADIFKDWGVPPANISQLALQTSMNSFQGETVRLINARIQFLEAFENARRQRIFGAISIGIDKVALATALANNNRQDPTLKFLLSEGLDISPEKKASMYTAKLMNEVKEFNKKIQFKSKERQDIITKWIEFLSHNMGFFGKAHCLFKSQIIEDIDQTNTITTNALGQNKQELDDLKGEISTRINDLLNIKLAFSIMELTFERNDGKDNEADGFILKAWREYGNKDIPQVLLTDLENALPRLKLAKKATEVDEKLLQAAKLNLDTYYDEALDKAIEGGSASEITRTILWHPNYLELVKASGEIADPVTELGTVFNASVRGTTSQAAYDYITRLASNIRSKLNQDKIQNVALPYFRNKRTAIESKLGILPGSNHGTEAEIKWLEDIVQSLYLFDHTLTVNNIPAQNGTIDEKLLKAILNNDNFSPLTWSSIAVTLIPVIAGVIGATVLTCLCPPAGAGVWGLLYITTLITVGAYAGQMAADELLRIYGNEHDLTIYKGNPIISYYFRSDGAIYDPRTGWRKIDGLKDVVTPVAKELGLSFFTTLATLGISEVAASYLSNLFIKGRIAERAILSNTAKIEVLIKKLDSISQSLAKHPTHSFAKKLGEELFKQFLLQASLEMLQHAAESAINNAVDRDASVLTAAAAHLITILTFTALGVRKRIKLANGILTTDGLAYDPKIREQLVDSFRAADIQTQVNPNGDIKVILKSGESITLNPTELGEIVDNSFNVIVPEDIVASNAYQAALKNGFDGTVSTAKLPEGVYGVATKARSAKGVSVVEITLNPDYGRALNDPSNPQHVEARRKLQEELNHINHSETDITEIKNGQEVIKPLNQYTAERAYQEAIAEYVALRKEIGYEASRNKADTLVQIKQLLKEANASNDQDVKDAKYKEATRLSEVNEVDLAILGEDYQINKKCKESGKNNRLERHLNADSTPPGENSDRDIEDPQHTYVRDGFKSEQEILNIFGEDPASVAELPGRYTYLVGGHSVKKVNINGIEWVVKKVGVYSSTIGNPGKRSWLARTHMAMVAIVKEYFQEFKVPDEAYIYEKTGADGTTTLYLVSKYIVAAESIYHYDNLSPELRKKMSILCLVFGLDDVHRRNVIFESDITKPVLPDLELLWWKYFKPFLSEVETWIILSKYNLEVPYVDQYNRANQLVGPYLEEYNTNWKDRFNDLTFWEGVRQKIRPYLTEEETTDFISRMNQRAHNFPTNIDYLLQIFRNQVSNSVLDKIGWKGPKDLPPTSTHGPPDLYEELRGNSPRFMFSEGSQVLLQLGDLVKGVTRVLIEKTADGKIRVKAEPDPNKTEGSGEVIVGPNQDIFVGRDTDTCNTNNIKLKCSNIKPGHLKIRLLSDGDVIVGATSNGRTRLVGKFNVP